MIPKFRAWDKEDESWIDIKSLGMMEGEITTLEEWDDDLPYFIEDLGKTWELMQATGLHDENKEEVFQDDIVWHDQNEEYGVVEINEAKFVIRWQDGYSEDLSERIDLLEVVGNIYEHSHLLDVEGLGNDTEV
ncbi:hypothetical protein CW674_01120 [Macrococcoides caseolyticum]|uniref:YopX family protein n=1 Tax=Macrococcoides caseolyticum TaxID=69966 RepID=UPI000C3295B4|nr:YopX family protein [Macrococcus caseolyticus]PKE66685.1 hypothetical protein CW674_01120 [Macrococcus caseolyticus]